MMEIELWPIDRPLPYAQNPRKIPQSAIDKVAASIKEFSWRQPIVVDAAGVIVVGHSRLLAARKLGLLEVPVHVATDLTEAQCRAYRIADNRAGEGARWDDKLLKLEISELGVLAELTGLDPKEMGRLGLAEDAAQDPIPAPPASPVARLGQIWQLGKHRLLCGDSTRPDYVSRLMGDERAILFATDPPYAIGYAGGSHPATRANRAKANRDKDWSKVYHESWPNYLRRRGQRRRWRAIVLSRLLQSCDRTRDRTPCSLVHVARIFETSDVGGRLERSWGFQPSTSHLVQEPTRPDLLDLYVGARAVSLRLDQGPEAARRSQLRQPGHGLAGSERRGGEQRASNVEAQPALCDSDGASHAPGRPLLRTFQRQRIATHRHRATWAKMLRDRT